MYEMPFLADNTRARSSMDGPDTNFAIWMTPREFLPLREFFEHDNPGLKLDLVSIDGEAVLASGQGGMRVFWIYRGEGEVFLARGYRTQEGDGKPLPDDYRADAIDPAFAATLGGHQDGPRRRSRPARSSPARAIVGRWRGAAYVGDYAGELWKLDHVPRPWSSDPQVEAALRSLFTMLPRARPFDQAGRFVRTVHGRAIN